jgi:hypothetical protein
MGVYVCSLETVRFNVYDWSLIFIGFHMLLKLFHLVYIHVDCSELLCTMSVYAMYCTLVLVLFVTHQTTECMAASSHISFDSLLVIILSFHIHYHLVL